MHIAQAIHHSFVEAYSSVLHFLSQLICPDFWIYLLEHYKYPIVVIGALVEGEMILLLAGGAAYHGYMSLYFVIIMAFVGAVIHDHVLFFLGRFFGKKLFNRSPKWHGRLSKVSQLIHKYDNYFIMSFRFIYGLRTLTPLMVGSSPMPLYRYSALVTLSAAIWATLIGGLGYTFALAFNEIMSDFAHYKKYIALALIAVVALAGFAIRFYGRFFRRPPLP